MNVELSSTGAAYIRYITNPSIDNVYVGDDETADVIVDVDEHGAVVGIESLDVSVADDTARARAFAMERGLQFPRISKPPPAMSLRLERSPQATLVPEHSPTRPRSIIRNMRQRQHPRRSRAFVSAVALVERVDSMGTLDLEH